MISRLFSASPLVLFLMMAGSCTGSASFEARMADARRAGDTRTGAAPTDEGKMAPPVNDVKRSSTNADPASIEGLEVSLVEKEPLCLAATKEHTDETQIALRGTLEVTLTNTSTHEMRLAHMFPANLLFADRKHGKELVLFHPCMPGFLLFDPVVPPDIVERVESVITLAPGEHQTLVMDDWGCDGGPFEPTVRPGSYDLYYRIHAWDPDKSYVPASKVAPLPADAGVKAMLKRAKQVLRSEWFWEGARTSPPLRVELRVTDDTTGGSKSGPEDVCAQPGTIGVMGAAAMVYIDGKKVGRTPLRPGKHKVLAGSHSVVCVWPDGKRSRTIWVRVAHGGRRIVKCRRNGDESPASISRREPRMQSGGSSESWVSSCGLAVEKDSGRKR